MTIDEDMSIGQGTGSGADVARVVTDVARLEAVQATGLLDSALEPSFDRLTRLAAKLTGAPTTFISLVDDQRDFYKSCFGFPEPLATERQITGTTFCHYALTSKGPLVIEDTLADPVYSSVSTVKSLGVRAYLGIPLTISSGQTIGSFCAIDFKPRKWTPLDIEVMQELATSTLREIELRMAVDTVAKDREDLRQLLQRNEGLYREAQNANQAKDDFFAAVTHELRTPMTSIIGWTNILRMEELASASVIEAVTMIESSARIQARLVDDLLDASRIATGKITLNRTKFDLKSLIEETVSAAAPVASAAGVIVRTALHADPVCWADRSRLRQILDNLISNAIKFTPAGGLIELTVASEKNEVKVGVRDTGRGIAAELLPHIFDRGRQARSAEKGGLGLGLSIASSLAALHGGSIHAESDGEGKGTMFTLTLPSESRNSTVSRNP